MSVSARYQPSHPEGQSAVYALDLSNILPPGVGVAAPVPEIFTNQSPPLPAADLTATATASQGRRAWTTLAGGTAGTDYLIRWSITDSQSNLWIISVLLLCAATS